MFVDENRQVLPPSDTPLPDLEPQPKELTLDEEDLPPLILEHPTPPIVSPDGWDCKKLVSGDWPLKLIRELDTPDFIEPGPYRLIHLDGSEQNIEHWIDFPTVYAGEEICVKVGGRGNESGTIYEAN